MPPPQCSWKGKKGLFGPTEELILCFAKGLAAMGTTPFLLSPFAVCCQQLTVWVQRHSSDPPDIRHHACFRLLASSQLSDDACYWLTALPYMGTNERPAGQLVSSSPRKPAVL